MKKVLGVAFPALVGTAIILANIPFGFLFEVGIDNVYIRKPGAVALLIITLFYVFYSIRIRYVHYKNEGKTHFFPIYMFLAPVIIGAVVQTLWYGISIDWCSASLGLVGLHISLQNELSYIDPLTRLLNRNFLNNVMADWHNRKIDACGLMIDVDKFKYINDTFGHSVGDEALKDTAVILQNAAPPRAHVIRFAGDEFMILLSAGSPADAEDMISSIAARRRSSTSTAKSSTRWSSPWEAQCTTRKRPWISSSRQWTTQCTPKKRQNTPQGDDLSQKKAPDGGFFSVA